MCKREKVLKFSGSVDECLINKCGISWKMVAKSVENLSKNYVRKENSMKFQVTCNSCEILTYFKVKTATCSKGGWKLKIGFLIQVGLKQVGVKTGRCKNKSIQNHNQLDQLSRKSRRPVIVSSSSINGA